MATEVKFKELSMNYFVLGENNEVQKVSLKSETMREKICSIFTENGSFKTSKITTFSFLIFFSKLLSLLFLYFLWMGT